MLAGWRERGLAAVGRGRSGAAGRAPGPDLTVVADAAAIPPDFAPAAVVLAVKPQNAAETLPRYARFAGSAVFLSIMAGRTIAGMQQLLGDDAAIVRAMPNTPAAVRQGITVACAGPGVARGAARAVRHAAAGDRRGGLGRGRRRCSIRSPPSPAAARPMCSCWPNCWSRRRSSRASRRTSPGCWRARR